MWICSFFTASTGFVLDGRGAPAFPPRPHIESLSWAVTQSSPFPRFPGRAPESKVLGLDKLGVQLNPETGKIVVGADESTSVPNIYAFGDIGEVRWRERPCDRRRRPRSFTLLLFTARSPLFAIHGFVMGGGSHTDAAPPTGTYLQEQSSLDRHLGELASESYHCF